MATYFVSSAGSNTSPYDTWAKAATSLATALLMATTAGDIVVIQYDGVPSGDSALSADTTYTISDGVWIVSASNDGGSSYTLTPMGDSNYIGHSSSNRSITLGASNGSKIGVWGLTLRVSGATTDNIRLGSAIGNYNTITLVNCYLWQANTSGAIVGQNGAYVKLIDCTLRFGSTSNYVDIVGQVELINCTLSNAGTCPSYLFAATGGGSGRAIGCDFSFLTTGVLNDTSGGTSRAATLTLDRCTLGSGVTVLGAMATSKSPRPDVYVLDCHSGDTHMQFGYHNALGSLTLDSAIYFTSNPIAVSWKVVTTSVCTAKTPFETPWIDKYNDTLSSITPYFEVLRDGSATAWKDSEVWAEFNAKTTSGSTLASVYDDRVADASHYTGVAGSDQATGAGAGSWTGEGGTIWSGKCDSGSAFTPAEVGYIRGRLVFGVPSETIYIDPVIHT